MSRCYHNSPFPLAAALHPFLLALSLLNLPCVVRFPALLLLVVFTAGALTQDELTLLQDPGGWEYMTITDSDNGFETQHVCFDPKTPGACRGNLLFRPDMTFKKSVKVHSDTVDRGGSYQVAGSNILFLDEFNNKDGPYTAQLNPDTKTLVLGMVQAGVHFRMELLQEKEFHRRQEEARKKAPGN